MASNQPHLWGGIQPHVRQEFDAESLQTYLRNIDCPAPADVFAQVDVDFYRAKYGDSLAQNADPIEHFFNQGWKSGHSPNEWFDTHFYLTEYGDVREAEVNPFEHFLLHGFKENRLPSFQTHSYLLQILNIRSESDPLNLRFLSTNQPPTGSLEHIISEIHRHLFTDARRMVVALGHDNYTRVIGGIQIIAGVEQSKFSELKTNYVFLFPSHPRLALAPEPEVSTYQAVVNGKTIPLKFHLPGLFHRLGEIDTLIVHSIFGHHPEDLAREIEASQINHFIWWIHDYSNHCENHLLAHNNRRPCKDPSLHSQTCHVCVHGSRRNEHVTRIQNLHQQAPWQFIAPSETAQTISTSGSTRLQSNPEVIAHGEISFNSQRTPQEIHERKLRIAFVGQPVHHKGWEIFQQFVNFSMVRNQEVDFFHFGSTESHNDFITYVNLTQTSNKIGLTTALLLQHQIDAVFVWSIHQETFNLVTYESMAAGCAIIARHSSGNIAAAASRHDRGILYTDETELFEDVQVFERVSNLVNTGLPTGQFVFTGTSTALKMGGAS